jgi:hypothetical protein
MRAMTAIDPIRRAARLRRAARADHETSEESVPPFDAGLPAIAGPGAAAREPEPLQGAAVFDAQLIGQGGEKRGLRAGPSHIEGAAKSYNRTEWSGSKDRRARKGGITRTQI